MIFSQFSIADAFFSSKKKNAPDTIKIMFVSYKLLSR